MKISWWREIWKHMTNWTSYEITTNIIVDSAGSLELRSLTIIQQIMKGTYF